MNTNINKRIAIGAGWLVSLRWVDRLIGFVSIAILARLLDPTDFGLVGYAMVFLTILDQFSMFNFKTVLIRDQNAPRERYDTAWTFEILKGLVLATIIIASAEIVANFFHEAKVEVILYWVAVIPVLTGLVNVGIIDFQKNLEFHKSFLLDVIGRLLGTIATIVLAIVLQNYWALVYGWIIRVFLRFLLSYVMSSYRPRLCLTESSRVLGFSSWLLALHVFQGVNANLPVIAIGRFFDAQMLAIFNMGKELTNLTSAQLAAPIRHALFPGVAKMQDNPSQMEDTVISALGIIVLIGLPAAIGIGVVAPLLVPAFLGDKWIDVAPIVTVLSFSAALHTYYPNSNVIFYSINRPNITALICLLQMCILVPAIITIVPPFGALGAAWTLVGVQFLMLIVDYVVLFRMTDITSSRVLAAVWRSSLSVVIMAFCVLYLLENPITVSMKEWRLLHLFACVASGIFSFTSSIAFLWWVCGTPNGPEAYIVRLLGKLSRRLTPVWAKARNIG